MALHLEITGSHVGFPEACRLLNISRPTLIRMLDRGDITELARTVTESVDENGKVTKSYEPHKRQVSTESIEKYLQSRGA